MIRHLFPRVHWTTYGDGQGGRVLVIWRQWGRKVWGCTQFTAS